MVGLIIKETVVHKVLVARATFPDIIDRLRGYFEVQDNPEDEVWSPEALSRALQGKAGLIATGSERIDEAGGLGVLGGLGQRGLGNLQVQLDELFDAFKGFLGEPEQGLDIGFVGGNQLFSGHHDRGLLGWVDIFMLHRNMIESIGE